MGDGDGDGDEAQELSDVGHSLLKRGQDLADRPRLCPNPSMPDARCQMPCAWAQGDD